MEHVKPGPQIGMDECLYNGWLPYGRPCDGNAGRECMLGCDTFDADQGCRL